MNSIVSVLLKKKIKFKGSLLGCFLLITFVMAPVVFGLIFMESMIEGIADKFIYLSDGHIQVPSDSLPSDQIFSEDKIIKRADYSITGYALVYSADNTASLQIKGVNNDYFDDNRSGQIKIIRDESIKLSENLGLLTISQNTADTLGVGIGDKLALMVVPDSTERPVRPVLMMVSAVYSSGYDQLDSKLAYTSLDYAKTLFPSVSSKVVSLILNRDYQGNPDKAAKLLGLDEYTTWIQSNYSVYINFLNSQQMILVVFLIISIVAAFFTSSVAQQLVQEDLKNISILKLLGTDSRTIKKVDFISVLFVTLVGMVTGLCLGTAMAYLVRPALSLLSSSGLPGLGYYLLDFTITIPWKNIISVFLTLTLLSGVSVIISLRRVSGISPMQLFRES